MPRILSCHFIDPLNERHPVMSALLPTLFQSSFQIVCSYQANLHRQQQYSRETGELDTQLPGYGASGKFIQEKNVRLVFGA